LQGISQMSFFKCGCLLIIRIGRNLQQLLETAGVHV
jgi:hypothetical protein